MANLTVTDELLTAALAGYQAELEQIDLKMGEIRRMLGDGTNHAVAATSNRERRPRRRFTKQSRARMAESQRLRWRKLKQAAEPTKAESAKPKKRKMSAAGKAAIVAAVKKRWAAVRAASKAQKPAVAKKAGHKGPKKSAAAPEQSAA